MKAAVLVLALLLAPPALRAQDCRSYARGSAAAPPQVQAWLAQSKDERVRVCAQAARAAGEERPLYAGESALSRRGAVCSYASHGLTLIGNGAASHLQRYESEDALAMALAPGECPTRHAQVEHYVTTYGIAPAVFEAIMQLWGHAAASAAYFAHTRCCQSAAGAAPGVPATAAAHKLDAAIAGGRMKDAPVLRVVRLAGGPFRRRYALTVTDPDSRPAGATAYVIYLRKTPRGPYQVSAVAVTNQ
jgi:hypothetical protein